MRKNKNQTKMTSTSITIPQDLFEMAKKRMKKRHFASFSEYVRDLIREDIERN